MSLAIPVRGLGPAFHSGTLGMVSCLPVKAGGFARIPVMGLDTVLTFWGLPCDSARISCMWTWAYPPEYTRKSPCGAAIWRLVSYYASVTSAEQQPVVMRFWSVL